MLRERNGLDRKKKNILGGNFNFVEQIEDRKREGADDAFNREQQVRDFFVNLSKKFKIKVLEERDNQLIFIVSLFFTGNFSYGAKRRIQGREGESTAVSQWGGQNR